MPCPQEIALTLLLSLRFMSLVFEEVSHQDVAVRVFLVGGAGNAADLSRRPRSLARERAPRTAQVRNLCLGLAARGVDWTAQGGRGSLAMASRLCVRLFANLFHRCARALRV